MKPTQRIRKGVIEDLPQLTRIYNESIASGYSTCDVTQRNALDRIRWFQQFSDRYPLWVYEKNNKVVGYACLFAWSIKAGYNYTVEDAVYISKESHNQGIGTALLKHLLTFCKQANYHLILARIFSKNPASIKLHVANGFEKVGHLKDVAHIRGQFEDVEIYSKIIQD